MMRFTHSSTNTQRSLETIRPQLTLCVRYSIAWAIKPAHVNVLGSNARRSTTVWTESRRQPGFRNMTPIPGVYSPWQRNSSNNYRANRDKQSCILSDCPTSFIIALTVRSRSGKFRFPYCKQRGASRDGNPFRMYTYEGRRCRDDNGNESGSGWASGCK